MEEKYGVCLSGGFKQTELIEIGRKIEMRITASAATIVTNEIIKHSPSNIFKKLMNSRE